MFNEDVSIEKGDKADGVAGASVLIFPIPKANANVADDAGGNGAAGAASFSIVPEKR